jgi:hypothetical protein
MRKAVENEAPLFGIRIYASGLAGLAGEVVGGPVMRADVLCHAYRVFGPQEWNFPGQEYLPAPGVSAFGQVN